MKKLLLLAFLFSTLSFAQIINPGGGSGDATTVNSGVVPASVNSPNILNTNSLGQFVSAAGNQIIQSGLLAEHKMTEVAGTSVGDSSGNGNACTFTGTNPTWLTDDTGGLKFTATGQGVPCTAALNTARTFFFWVDLYSANTNQGAWYSPLGTAGPKASSASILLANLGSSPVPNNNAGIANDTPVGFPSAIGVWEGLMPAIYAYGAAGASPWKTRPRSIVQGSFLLAYTLGSASDSPATFDHIYVNGIELNNYYVNAPSQQGQSAGLNSSVYWLGGSGANTITTFGTYMPVDGILRYAAFYSTALTAGQVAFNSYQIINQLASRGIFPSTSIVSGYPYINILASGDSITIGTATTTRYTQFMPSLALNASSIAVILNNAYSGLSLVTQVGKASFTDDVFYRNAAPDNVIVGWLGTNDLSAKTCTASNVVPTTANLYRWATERKLKGWKFIPVTMISRGPAAGDDNCKNVYNTWQRSHWRDFSPAFADVAADPRLGADGANVNTTYFTADKTHMTSYSQANIAGPIIQRSILRLIGCTDFSCAPVYTTGTPAATTVTASSESGNTATYTFAVNPFVVGQMVTCSEITPAGYNNAAESFQVLTSSATQITGFLQTASLGVGTVFGSCSAPMLLPTDGDHIRLAGTAVAPSFTLDSCVGYTGQSLWFKNENTTSPWVLTPYAASETIDGAASLTMPVAAAGHYPVVQLTSQLISATAAGCTWAVSGIQ